MSRYQLALLPALAVAIVALAGAIQSQTDAQQVPWELPDGASVSPDEKKAALAALDRAVAALAPTRVSWMEVKVWQQARVDGRSIQAKGRIVTAPGDRVRFDLNVAVGPTIAELRVVSNGERLWQSTKVAGEKVAVQEAVVPADRVGFLRANGFAGIFPMLHALRQGVHEAQSAKGKWNNHDVVIVSGALPELASSPPSDGLAFGPDIAVRHFRLYLDEQTSWPYRMEWWGRVKPSQVLQQVMQTEFRTPVLNSPLSAERQSAEFSAPW
jgi:hypothetical protein